jgi:phage baseplate assembly protein W
MAIDFGDDIDGVLDVNSDFAIATPERALVQAALRRLTTPRGSLFYDPEYGYSLLARVADTIDDATTFETASGVRAELERDERVLSAEVEVIRTELALDVRVRLETNEGPYRLVLRATEVAVDLLSSEAL